MARSTPTIRTDGPTVELRTGDDHIAIPVDSDAWFAWLETAHTFAFDDPVGRFTARKKRRLDAEYWYAFRRLRGRYSETYLGKAADVTLARLRRVAVRLNDLAGWTPPVQQARAAAPAEGEGARRGSTKHTAGTSTRKQMAGAPAPKLTLRQQQVLRLIALGRSNNDIARDLVISPATVKRHVSNILMALDVRNRTQAVARARELHYFDADSYNGTSKAVDS